MEPLASATANQDQADEALSVEGLYRLYANVVARWAHRLGGPEIDADDLVQQVFLSVQRRLPSLRSAASVRAWLFRITQNEVRQARRRNQLRGWLGLGGKTEARELQADSTPEDDLERRQARRTVYAVLNRMGEKYRSVLILFQLEELSGEEIADLTGLKLATVWVRLHRARSQFLRLLAELEGLERGKAP